MLATPDTFASTVANLVDVLTTTQVGIYVVVGIVIGLVGRTIAAAKKAGR